MAYKLNLTEDEVFIKGRSGEKAAELLKKAESAGIDPRLVRTTAGGYIVPKSLQEGEVAGKKANPDVASVVTENTNTDLAHPDTPETEGAQDDKFDPSEHTVEEVKAYLESADDEERQRVVDAELNGKARKSLLPDTEGDED